MKKEIDMSTLLKAAKKDKKALVEIKNLAVKLKELEIASQIMGLEKELFPETKEQIEAKKLARDLKGALSMVDLNVEDSVCWVMFQTFNKFKKVGSNFSIKDSAVIMTEQDMFFK